MPDLAKILRVTRNVGENILNLRTIIEKRLTTSRYGKLAEAVEQVSASNYSPVNRTNRASRRHLGIHREGIIWNNLLCPLPLLTQV